MVEGLCRLFLGSGLAAVCFFSQVWPWCCGCVVWCGFFVFFWGGRTVGDGTARLVGDFLVYVS